MKIARRFTKPGHDALSSVEYERRTSRITNPDGSVVFEMNDAEIPKNWSQLATDIMVSKYFRKAGVPQKDENGQPLRDAQGNIVTGPEKSAREVVNRLSGCWRHWAEKHGYFDSPQDAQAFQDEISYMLLHQMCAPNSPQWFNTGLNFAYGITGPSQGHFYCDPRSGELLRSKDAYSHPQPHACQPYHALVSTPQGPIAIGDIVSGKLIGLEVFDGREHGAATTRVLAVKSNGEKPVFRVVLKNGAAVEATADHVVWAIDERRTGGQWLRVDQLVAGQRMHLSTVTSVTKASAGELEVMECALAGWLQGDGFIGQYLEGANRSLAVEWTTVDDDEHDYVMRRVARVFEGVPFNVRAADAQDSSSTIRHVQLHGEKLRPFVEKYQLLRAGSDHAVPAAVRRAGAAAQYAYLAALFQTDGAVRRRPRDRARTNEIVLTTVSAELAGGVQALLLNLGIYARLQRGIDKRENRRIPLRISIGETDARARFQQHIGFISETQRQKLSSACSAEPLGRQMPPLREEAIVRIELVGTQPVFDIQTESGQYLSNNVVVHNCFIQSVSDDLVNSGGIMDLWTREARLFKYGSGTGSNFSKLRRADEPLSGGGRSSGLMSFLKIGDRAAGAIKSGGTTRRAAKMVCLDLDHPDIEDFVNWKVREELKVAAMAEGIKHLPRDQQQLAERVHLKLDYDFNGEAYVTVSGQNSNNSVRIPNRFFKAVEEDGDWTLYWRTNHKKARTIKARDLWEQISMAAWRCADPGVQYDDTINQWHTCPRSGRINASNPCVTGDTRVLTPGGIWRRIDAMIHLPSRVITNRDAQEIHATDGAFPTGLRDVYELRTNGGYSVKLTADHKVWTRHRGWVAAGELDAGDEVKLPSQPACVQEIGEPQEPRFFQMLGLFVSAANNDTSALHLDACLPNYRAADDLAQYAGETWSIRAYPDDYVNHAMVNHAGMDGEDARAGASDEDDRLSNGGENGGLNGGLNGRSSNGGNDRGGDTLTLSLTNRRLISRLSAFTRMDAGGRRLSEEAFTAGLPAQKHLLRALFTADGQFVRNTIELRNSGLGLLQDIQMLLLGFGVQSAIVSTDDPAAALTAFPESRRTPASSPASSARSEDLTAAIGAVISTSTSTATSGGLPGDAEKPRHGLRIDPGSLRSFAAHVALLPGQKSDQLAAAASIAIARPRGGGGAIADQGNWDRVSSFKLLGPQQVYDLTEPRTSSFIANGLTVHNCSEYMFLDDTACNLASLNVMTFFDDGARSFDIEAYKHAVRLWTIVLETSVLMASFPSEEIARLSYKFRTLGLGYANLGAMLMQAGIPYDSDEGRAVCAALTAILTGESYATSAELAAELGAFAGYEENKSDMLRVIRNHRRAAYDVAHAAQPARQKLGDYETLDIKPVGIDAGRFSQSHPLISRQLLHASQECWDRALALGERHGYRNAQVSVIAPTGTIGLLMDCDTTGVEPDFALVKFKKLSGGGYFKIANQSLRPALKNLGYSGEQIHDIIKYVMGALTLHDAPHLNWDRLKMIGFSEEDLNKIEASLPGVFEVGFAFSPWALSPRTFERLGIGETEWQAPGFNLLKKLGFTRKQIDEANDVICGRGTVESAPHLKAEHYPVFDCANKCGKIGRRFIAVEGHIRMMAAAQPFISGAISKTINLPHEATVEDIKNSYRLSWELGLKANALYRDGSKLSQPLNAKSDQDVDQDVDQIEADDEENVNAARDEVASQVAGVAAHARTVGTVAASSDNISGVPMHQVEKIIERIVERPLRRRLPDTRRALTHKFDVAGHEGYITVGLYDDGQPGEVFITMAKEGSTIGGLMDTIATLVSVALQYGVPVESLVKKFEHVRFEPSGMTRNREIPIAKSLVDYIFRWLAMEFISGYRAANAPRRVETGDSAAQGAKAQANAPVPSAQGPSFQDGTSEQSNAQTSTHSLAPSRPLTSTREPLSPDTPTTRPHGKNGNGNTLHPHDEATGTSPAKSTLDFHPGRDDAPITGSNLRMAIAGDPVSQQSSELQTDAPACDVCGSITVRSGTCYKCLNCGNSMGCS